MFFHIYHHVFYSLNLNINKISLKFIPVNFGTLLLWSNALINFFFSPRDTYLGDTLIRDSRVQITHQRLHIKIGSRAGIMKLLSKFCHNLILYIVQSAHGNVCCLIAYIKPRHITYLNANSWTTFELNTTNRNQKWQTYFTSTENNLETRVNTQSLHQVEGQQ